MLMLLGTRLANVLQNELNHGRSTKYLGIRLRVDGKLADKLQGSSRRILWSTTVGIRYWLVCKHSRNVERF